MPDVPMPPVGELVQITDQQGRVTLGYRHHEESKNWLERLGRPPIRLADVQSWCRVLVLPDTETNQRALRMKLWSEMVELGVEDSQARQHSVVLASVAFAAVRGAAFR